MMQRPDFTCMKIAKEEVREKKEVRFKDLEKLSPVPVRVEPEAIWHGGAYYRPQSDDEHIGLLKKDDSSLNALAHEIGHAEFQRTLPGKITQNRFVRRMHNAGALPSVVHGLLRPSKRTWGHHAGHNALLNLGLSAPTLVSEAAANMGGYSRLKSLGASDKQLDAYTNTALGSQGSYLLGTLINTGFGIASIPRYKLGALDGKLDFKDLPISVETAKGNYRYWKDPHDGSQGKTKMKYPYGYIRGTKGMDGEAVDCFVGPNQEAKNVYVVTTNKPPTFSQVDEQKCMLGFNSAADAKAAFRDHYDDERFFREMRSFPYPEFRDKVLATRKGVAKLATTLLGGVCESR